MACLGKVLGRSADVVLGSPGLEIGAAVLESIGQGELGRNTLNTVRRVDVLDEGDLETGGAALSGDDGGVSKEELPNLFFEVSIRIVTCQ